MEKATFRYVQSFTDRRGTKRHYLRYPGAPRVTLHGEPGSRDFDASYHAAIKKAEDALSSRRGASHRAAADPALDLPATEGVYLLLRGEHLAYVGTSKNMQERVARHRMNGRVFDRAFCILASAEDRFLLEKALVTALEPRDKRQLWRNLTIKQNATSSGK